MIGSQSKMWNEPQSAQVARSRARRELRNATQDVHLRLHQHPVLHALATGRADRAAYVAALARLYGFHAPLERVLLQESGRVPYGIDMDRRCRAGLLRRDLAALGLVVTAIDRLPAVSVLPALDTPGRVLGALYVREGSTLGSAVMARQLDSVFGNQSAGRLFLSGGGDGSDLWRDLCSTLETAAEHGHLPDMLAAAQDTFAVFEAWLGGPDENRSA